MTPINEDRGEVGITLGGRVYPMLPDMTAVSAIESQIGSVYWLSQRVVLGQYFPTFREIGIVVAECIRAAGKSRNDPMLNVSTDKITEMVFTEGLNDDNVVNPFVRLLSNMVGGGAKKKANTAASPTPSAPTESTTAN